MAYRAALLFVVASSCLAVYRGLLGHETNQDGAHQDLGEEDEKLEEDGDSEQAELRRIGSEFSIGLNRVKSVDDMINEFEWEFCTTGQRALHALRISGYVLIGSLLITRIAKR